MDTLTVGSHRTRRAAIAVMLVLAVVMTLTTTGCKKTDEAEDETSASESTQTVSTEETQTAEEPVVVSSGPITTPAYGTSERTALMDAARDYLGTTSQFMVYQLYVQGNVALGDIEPVSGGERIFIAWTSDSPWQGVWHVPFAQGSAAAAIEAVPRISQELAAKIDWKMPKPLTAADMLASLKVEVKKWSNTAMSGVGSPYTITAKVAQSADGSWWGVASSQPSPSGGNSYESLQFWCSYSGGKWTGEIQDPEPPAPSTYFPADVIGTLF